MEGIEVVRAGPADVERVAEILEDATALALSRGFDLWPVPFPRDELLDLIQHHEVYLLIIDGAAASTFRLQWSDPEWWGEDDGRAGYIHKLAVRRQLAGRGLGARMLGLAAERVLARGRDLLRLDTQAENPGLNRYYVRQGFRLVKTVVVRNWPCNLYEKRLAAPAE